MLSRNRLFTAMNEQFLPPKLFEDVRIAFGTPEALTEEPYRGLTRIQVSGKSGKGYYGSVSLDYRRLDVVSLTDISEGMIELRKYNGWTVSDFTRQLNGLFNAGLSDAEIVVNDGQPIITPEPGQSLDTTIRVTADSVAWYGEVPVRITNAKAYFTAMLPEKELDAIQFPHGKRDYPAAWVSMYYMDFTAYRDAIAIDSVTRQFKKPELVLDLMKRLGFPSFEVSDGVDRATMDVPESNQTFDRVVVLQGTGNQQFYGPMYFHYNLFDEVKP